jgi:adenylate kinase
MSHISTGDLLRAAIANGTPLGKQAHAYMERGELVPDGLVIGMIADRLARAGKDPSFILDGFPRTVAQADALEQMLAAKHIPLDHVMSIEVPRDEVVRRLSGRRTCSRCGTMFHVDFDPSRRPGVCDRCGSELYQRDDDREETIRARLEVYDKATKPLAAFYKSRGLLRDIDGTGTAAQVLERMRAQLNGRH